MKIKSPAGVKVKTEGGERADWRGGRSGFLIQPQSSLASISCFCVSLENICWQLFIVPAGHGYDLVSFVVITICVTLNFLEYSSLSDNKAPRL